MFRDDERTSPQTISAPRSGTSTPRGVRIERVSNVCQGGSAYQGVNERNIRVVYLRPYQHSWNGRSLEATNVEIVRRIAAGIRADHKRIASASAFSNFPISAPTIPPRVPPATTARVVLSPTAPGPLLV